MPYKQQISQHAINTPHLKRKMFLPNIWLWFLLFVVILSIGFVECKRNILPHIGGTAFVDCGSWLTVISTRIWLNLSERNQACYEKKQPVGNARMRNTFSSDVQLTGKNHAYIFSQNQKSISSEWTWRSSLRHANKWIRIALCENVHKRWYLTLETMISACIQLNLHRESHICPLNNQLNCGISRSTIIVWNEIVWRWSHSQSSVLIECWPSVAS